MPDSWEDITKQHTAESPGRGGTPTAEGDTPEQPPSESFARKAGREVVGNLPAIGATAGGIIGAPGVATGVLGAAAGAGLGETARQAIVSWFPTLGSAPEDASESVKKIAEQTAFGAGTEVAAPYIGKLFEMASPWVKNSARKSLLAVMNPTDKYAKGHALDAADQLLEGPASKYVSLTRKGLEKRAEKNISSTGAKIGAAETAAGQTDIKAPLVGELNQALADYKQSLYMPKSPLLPTDRLKYGLEPNLKALENIEEKLRGEFPGANAQGMPSGGISRESLRLIRQNVDKAVKRSEGFARDALSRGGAVEPALASKIEVEQDAGNIFRKILNKDKPDIAALNEEYHLWNNVKDAMSPATLNKAFSKESSPWQQLWHDRYAAWLGTAALGAGVAKGGISTGHAAEATGVLFAINQLVHSAAWRTTSAWQKNKLADMLAQGQLEGAAKLATRVAIQRDKTMPPPVRQKAKDQTSTVQMKAPDGTTQDVPKDQVEHYKTLGASVIQ